MSGPSHGYWCNSKTYPTTCKICNAKIFYFTCDCGCKVFFDNLGWPWRIHGCYKNEYEEENDPYITEKREDAKWSFIPKDDFKVEDNYLNNIKDNNKKEYERPIIKIENDSNETIIIEYGKVTDFVKNINLYQKFNILENSIGSKLLNKIFSNKEYNQLTIHSKNLTDNKINSYTFLLEKGMIKEIEKGLNISVVLFGNIVNKVKYWGCKIIEIM